MWALAVYALRGFSARFLRGLMVLKGVATVRAARVLPAAAIGILIPGKAVSAELEFLMAG